MKNLYVLIVAIISFSIKPVHSQELIKDFLAGPGNDSQELIEGWMAPFGAWFGSGLNAGWYNTGKPHRFPGFDVTAGIHFITPPEGARTFKPDLETLVVNSANGEISTFVGPDNTSEIGIIDPQDPNNFIPLFQAPGGIGWDKSVPMPYVQGSIGLIRDTEILFRIAPKINAQDLKMGYWGFGLKHDFKQWIPGAKILPFDLSFLAGYSKLNSSLTFNPGQDMSFGVKAFNSNLILSKKILFFTPYVGVGYQYSKSALKLNGEYTIYDWNGSDIEPGYEMTINDPFDFSFGGVNGFKATMGARVKLFLFTLHVDWTKAEYDVFTIGLGLNSDIGSKIIGGSIEKGIRNPDLN